MQKYTIPTTNASNPSRTLWNSLSNETLARLFAFRALQAEMRGAGGFEVDTELAAVVAGRLLRDRAD